VELLKQTREQLEELFLLVVVGEFNAGKSAFLNAMLGKKYLKEGGTFAPLIALFCVPPESLASPLLASLACAAPVIPTTSKITSIRHGEAASSVLPTEEPDREVIYLPVDWLKVLPFPCGSSLGVLSWPLLTLCGRCLCVPWCAGSKPRGHAGHERHSQVPPADH
jgi:hypothetical protein